MDAIGQPIEPCAGCGRETRSGSRLFSDRLGIDDVRGRRTYRCGDCNERAIDHAARRPGEGDMVKLAARAAGLGMAARRGAGPGSGSG